MEMWTGSSTGRADVANNLAFEYLDAGADPGGKIIEVSVAARISGVMLDVDRFAVSAVPTCFGDYTVANRPDRRASLSSKIYSRVREIRF